ncbi:hypothetical protein [Actinophytocola gossypii]|uniref:hypothetical protein n=1 Tax=Actinophytocola gossypii TaxID=2812003 RepID=UPI0021A8C62D|nr:hypothetical protein [Actinophytocola gossypii]
MQVDHDIEVSDHGHRADGDPFRIGGVARSIQGVGEPRDQDGVPLRLRGRAVNRLTQQVDRGSRCLGDQGGRGAGQPVQECLVQGTGIGHLDRLQQLPGDAMVWNARVGQCPGRVQVPHRADGLGYVVVEHSSDQRVSERELLTSVPQHTRNTGLIEDEDQLGNAPTNHDREVRDEKVHAQQRGGLHDRTRLAGQEVKTVRDHSDQ